jgi:GNAT superfamily N-acetyltransferase
MYETEAFSGAPLQPWQFLAHELRLDLHDVSVASLDGWKQRLTGVRLTNLSREHDRDPASLDRIYALHCDCYLHQPPLALRRAPIPFHLWIWGSLEARDEALPDAYFVARAARRYVGVSTVVRLRRLPGVLECRFTGVLPEFAGRGIGHALKAETVRYAIEHGYRELRTVVLADNVPMLRINESLGFQLHRSFIQSYPQLMQPQPA